MIRARRFGNRLHESPSLVVLMVYIQFSSSNGFQAGLINPRNGDCIRSQRYSYSSHACEREKSLFVYYYCNIKAID